MLLAALLAGCGGGGSSNSSSSASSKTGSDQTKLPSEPQPTPQSAVKFVEFSTRAPDAAPLGIAMGSDGAVWFAESNTNQISRMTWTGEISSYSIPTGAADPGRVVLGPDKAVWFTEFNGNNIGRITTDGRMTEYPLPTKNAGPNGINPGPDDGALWFCESKANQIAKIDARSGKIQEFKIPSGNAQCSTAVAGPDGNIWFTEWGTGKIGRIGTGGGFEEYEIGNPNAGPAGITVGADRNLYFSMEGPSAIGKMSTSGKLLGTYSTPTPGADPLVMAFGQGGLVWFAEGKIDSVASISPSGTITEYRTTDPHTNPSGITLGPGGVMWFAEKDASKIAHF
jgi:virginiamycin B lyase